MDPQSKRQPKRILFCEIYNDGTVGGSHSVMYNIVKHIDRRRITPIVGFCGNNLYFEKYDNIGVPIIDLPSPIPSDLIFSPLRKFLNWYKLIFKKTMYLSKIFKDLKVDLVVINNTLYTADPYISACKKLNIPIVVHERGTNYYSNREIALSEYISASIPVSDSIHQHLIKQRIRSKKIIRIYDGIPYYKNKNEKKEIETKTALGIEKDSRVIGMVGNIKAWKGQAYFISAMIELCSIYEDVYAIIVGGCSEKDSRYKEKCNRLISEAKLEERILMTGYRTDVNDLLSIFDISVHASTRAEPFGMVILEAMASKTPVIATNFGGPVELLNEGECGQLVSPKSAKEIVASCVKYLEDKEFQERMVNKAYNRFKKEFMIDKSIEKLTDIYLCSI